MKHQPILLAVLCSFVLLAACATSGKTADIRVGMNRQDVIAKMGPPDSSSAQGTIEVLSYYFCYSNCAALIVENRGRNWYYVKLLNGTVNAYGNNEAFGIKGDFDSSKAIAQTRTIKQEITYQGSGDVYSELRKLQELKDAGTLTQEEFDARKKKILSQ